MSGDNGAEVGHNSALNKDEKKALGGYLSEIVALEQQKRETQSDIKDVYASAKDAGFSTKALRRVVKAKLRTREEKIAEQSLQELTETYMHALGMLADTPLGEAAIARDLGGAQVDLEDAIEGAGNKADVTARPF